MPSRMFAVLGTFTGQTRAGSDEGLALNSLELLHAFGIDLCLVARGMDRAVRLALVSR